MRATKLCLETATKLLKNKALTHHANHIKFNLSFYIVALVLERSFFHIIYPPTPSMVWVYIVILKTTRQLLLRRQKVVYSLKNQLAFKNFWLKFDGRFIK